MAAAWSGRLKVPAASSKKEKGRPLASRYREK
jgi:hypothetical protein